jgi:hypothetical protein
VHARERKTRSVRTHVEITPSVTRPLTLLSFPTSKRLTIPPREGTNSPTSPPPRDEEKRGLGDQETTDTVTNASCSWPFIRITPAKPTVSVTPGPNRPIPASHFRSASRHPAMPAYISIGEIPRRGAVFGYGEAGRIVTRGPTSRRLKALRMRLVGPRKTQTCHTKSPWFQNSDTGFDSFEYVDAAGR